MRIPKNNSLLENARNLRREMTPQERKLWYLFLRKYPVKIYKQRIIGMYIADFYCASARTVIEIDGSQHYDVEGRRKDAERTAYLNNLGLQVLRFSNADINNRFDQVCEAIHQHLRQNMP
jgi:very-short-patch-repair endonuclease